MRDQESINQPLAEKSIISSATSATRAEDEHLRPHISRCPFLSSSTAPWYFPVTLRRLAIEFYSDKAIVNHDMSDVCTAKFDGDADIGGIGVGRQRIETGLPC
jgi:hypothetical protein